MNQQQRLQGVSNSLDAARNILITLTACFAAASFAIIADNSLENKGKSRAMTAISMIGLILLIFVVALYHAYLVWIYGAILKMHSLMWYIFSALILIFFVTPGILYLILFYS